MFDEACALSGRKGFKVGPDNDDVAADCGLQPGDLAMDGALKTDDLHVSETPHVSPSRKTMLSTGRRASN